MRFENVHVIILAGGKGTRLKPYTTFVPKPLMPIGDFPIVEVVLRQLSHAGLKNVTMAVGHMGQLIQAFVGDGSKYGLKIDYSFEDEPLGTAGPIYQLRERLVNKDCFLAINGDLLTTLNLSNVVDFHLKKKPTATLCLNRREVSVEFGVIETNEKGELVEYKEKPTLSYRVSMGINVFSPAALEFIPHNQFFNIPDLMLAIRDSGQKVLGFEEKCYWLDIGRLEDYSLACDTFEQRRSEFIPE